ncbi:hypothetical protein PV325_000417 [Microctonus aethiopoides]|uniref:Ribosome-binding factor A, mitochondrial n=1 Tax=Microctonus aethiopoides TaxID=144406 RepID=A0AA39FB11_9HYME|nr:hypothetical protein PV325_000417 [Microctonus aethiopoides]KAK0166252.1 hypothetical protein PV328_004691 [Microctonus aethiopoides]
MILRRIFITCCACRHITTSVPNYRFKGLAREGKFMKKMIYGEIPKKKWYPAKDARPSELINPIVTNPTKSHVTRRVTVLNKLFMKHITDLMATGEIASSILGRGIEVSHVSVTNDFKLVKVFWLSSNASADELKEISEILNECGYKLRHELSQLKVIGVVPPIRFFEDKGLRSMMDLERKFLTADYGEDYTPTIKTERPSHLTLFTKLPSEVREKILNHELNKDVEESNDKVETEEEEEEEENEIYDINLPPMRHDVLNLDHWRIMSKITHSMKKCEETARNRMNNLATVEKQQPFDSSKIIERTEEDATAFEAFLLQRRILKKKLQENMELSDSKLEIGEEIEDNDDNIIMEDDADDIIDLDVDQEYDNWKK